MVVVQADFFLVENGAVLLNRNLSDEDTQTLDAEASEVYFIYDTLPGMHIEQDLKIQRNGSLSHH